MCSSEGARFGWWVLPLGENNRARCAVITVQVHGLWVSPGRDDR